MGSNIFVSSSSITFYLQQAYVMVPLTAKHAVVGFRMNSCALRAFEEEKWVKEWY